MQVPPQLFQDSERRAPVPTAAPRAGQSHAHVRRRLSKPARVMTSLELTPAQSEALESIAKRRGVTKASVLREGLEQIIERELGSGSAQ